jgi:hypothetical protein
MKTFKEINQEKPLKKRLLKHGSSIGITFSKDEVKRYNLDLNKNIVLDDAYLEELQLIK